ncbi:MAG: ABC transporter substrate-binding protein [Rhizobiaceae bacterium]|nr:ABC transporter substrate-binding protein [Rhizobiaceae bacterium]
MKSLAGVVALSFGTCAALAQDTVIKLGISPFQDTMLPIVGQQKGWFKEAGLDVKLVTLGWDAIVPAVVSGGVDVAINNTTGVVSIAGRATDMIYWYGWNPFTEGSALMGRPDKGLVTVDDQVSKGVAYEEARRNAFEQLKGRSIVTTMATDMGKQVVTALESVNLSQTDAKIIDMNPDQGLAAFLSGTGDAYLGGIPQRTRATAEGMIVIASGPDLAPPPINGFVTTKTFAEKNQDAMLALMNVMFRIVRYCNDNTADCGKIITGELNAQTGAQLTVEGFVGFWQVFENYAGNASEVQEAILDDAGYSYWKKTWDGDNQFLIGSGSIDKPVDAAEHFWGNKVQDLYIAKYGADEKGY